MSYAEDFGHCFPPDFGEGDEDYTLSCKLCGQASLHWEEVAEGKWRLFAEDGHIHKCGGINLNKAYKHVPTP